MTCKVHCVMIVLQNLSMLFFSMACMASIATADPMTIQEQAVLATVGQEIFQDTQLSEPVGTSCMSCHQPAAAFADTRAQSLGAKPGTTGTRNAPSLMYVALIPNMAQEDLLQDDGSQVWVWQGGLFQDGSARTLYEQIRRPIFAPNEMNLADEADLAARLRRASYATKLRGEMAEADWNNDSKVAHRAYRALVEFLKEPMFRPFDARIDDFLQGDQSALTDAEKRGLEIFRNKGKCADCHFLHATSWPQALLSDFGYDNLGVPALGPKDQGLATHTRAKKALGQFRAPSLRNVALTEPYFHNGSVATLKEVIEFYNKRDKEPQRWGKTDYPETVNHDDLGDLGLTENEIDDLVALMNAFTDRTLLAMRSEGSTLPQALADTPSTWTMRSYFPDWNYALPALPAHPPRKDDLLPTTSR